nr:hypothetical protein [Jeotgalibaca ciconiae]
MFFFLFVLLLEKTLKLVNKKTIGNFIFFIISV